VQIDMLGRFGLKVFYGDACRVDLLESAGARQAKLLVIAVGDPEKTLEIVERAKHAFPNLTILARARGRREAYALLAAGVEHVYRESFGSSLDLGIDALRLLGFRGHEAHRAAALFRKYDERAVRELAKHAPDSPSYVSAARERIELLNKVLQDDARRAGKVTDHGWDPPGKGARG
jgi:voltage-gated potassium channel Kch